jgi:acyl-CoA thioesterase-2
MTGQAPQADAIASVLSALDLVDTHARTNEDIFTAHSEPMPIPRIFGGQVLAQSVVAAQRTIEGRDIHSMHGYFLRPGNIDLPITFSVDRIHDGRSFATRRVQAYQDGSPIFSMIASFQTPDVGLDHQVEMPQNLRQPEHLPTLAESLGAAASHPAASWLIGRPFDMRGVDEPIWISAAGDRVANQAVWFKAISPLPDDPLLHTALLAYASDYSILQPVFRRHGVPWAAPKLRVASLDHAMWFHRQARVDEWMLYAQESPNASGGRGLAFGRIFSRDGRLIASVAQEGMIRVPRDL